MKQVILFVAVLTSSHHRIYDDQRTIRRWPRRNTRRSRRSETERERSGHILLVQSHGTIHSATRHLLTDDAPKRHSARPKRAFCSSLTLADSARPTLAEWRVVQSQGSGQSNLSASRDARRYAAIRRAVCTFPLARAAHFTLRAM